MRALSTAALRSWGTDQLGAGDGPERSPAARPLGGCRARGEGPEGILGHDQLLERLGVGEAEAVRTELDKKGMGTARRVDGEGGEMSWLFTLLPLFYLVWCLRKPALALRMLSKSHDLAMHSDQR